MVSTDLPATRRSVPQRIAGLIVRAGQYTTPIRAESHGTNIIFMFIKSLDAISTGYIPEDRGVITRPGEDAERAVGAECHRMYDCGLRIEGTQLLARDTVPKRRGAGRCRENMTSIGAEGHRLHSTGVGK